MGSSRSHDQKLAIAFLKDISSLITHLYISKSEEEFKEGILNLVDDFTKSYSMTLMKEDKGSKNDSDNAKNQSMESLGTDNQNINSQDNALKPTIDFNPPSGTAMTKSTYIIIVVAIFFIIAGGAYWIYRSLKRQDTPERSLLTTNTSGNFLKI